MTRHFEWGEYDSLSAQVPLVLADNESLLTPEARAELHKYLGVAAFVHGDTAEAEPHYRQAFELDGSVQLDSLYINRQVFLHFLAVKQLWQMENRDQKLQSAGVSTDTGSVPMPEFPAGTVTEAEFKSGASMADSYTPPLPGLGEIHAGQRELNKKKGKPQVRRWTLGGVCIAGSGLFGFLSWNEFRKAEENQRLHEEARNQRNRELMNDIKKKILRNDILTLTYGGAALGALSTGLTLILWKKNKNSGKLKEPETPVSFSLRTGERYLLGILLSMRY